MDKYEIYRCDNNKIKDVTVKDCSLIYTGMYTANKTIQDIVFDLYSSPPKELNAPLLTSDIIVQHSDAGAKAFRLDIGYSELQNFFVDKNNIIDDKKSKYKESLSRVNDIYANAIKKIENYSSIEEMYTILKSFSNLYHYSFKNAILIEAQRPNSKFLASYTDWNEKFNTKIKRGEKAINIFVYAESKVINKTPEIDKSTNSLRVDEKGKAIIKTDESIKRHYNLGNVFDVSQVIGSVNIPTLVAEHLTIDVLTSTLNKLAGDNPMAQLLKDGETDLNNICTSILHKLENNKNKTFIDVATDYVVCNALNLPFNGDLKHCLDNYNGSEKVADLRQIKAKSGYILKRIESQLNTDKEVFFNRDTIDQNDNLTQPQKQQIIQAYNKGLSSEDISVFAKPHINANVMGLAITAFNEGLTKQEIKTFVEDFIPDQILEIIKAYKNPKSTPYLLAVIKNPDLGAKEMSQINRAIDLMATPEQIQILINNNWDWTNMFEIVNAIEDNLSIEQIKIIADSKLNASQMCQVRLGFSENQLSIDEVKSYAHPEIDSFAMARQIEVIKELKAKGIKNIQPNSLDYLVADAKKILNEQKQQHNPDLY